MTDKFQGKYRIRSARLQNWDYGWNAMYFVTICTQGRACFFGDVAGEKMELTRIGEIAERYWNEIPQHFPFVKLDQYVVMPNHVHGIIVIDKPVDNNIGATLETPNLGVSTITTNNRCTAKASKKWQPATLGVIINQYKRICTIKAREINRDFKWQSRFHEHIIQNDRSFKNIQNYINENPLKWGADKFYKK